MSEARRAAARRVRSTAAAGYTVLPADRTPAQALSVRASVEAWSDHVRGGVDLQATAYPGLLEALTGGTAVARVTGGAGAGGNGAGGTGNGAGGNGNGAGGTGNGNGGTGTGNGNTNPGPGPGTPGGNTDPGPGTGPGTGDGPGNSGNGNGFGGPTPVEALPQAGPWSPTEPTVGVDLEAWGHLRFGTQAVQAEVVGAWLGQTAEDVAHGGVVGVVGSHRSGLRLEASCTVPRGGAAPAWRVSPSWWIGRGRVAVEPFVAGQYVAGQWRGTGGASVYVMPGPLAVWAGGRYGPQRTATLLGLRSSAPWPDLDRGGVWAGVRLGRIERTWASASWSATWLDPDDADPEPARPAHTLSASLSLAL